MSVPQTARRPFEIRGWHVLAAVCAFFGVVIAVDMAFLVLAYRTFPGQVSVTPYEDGLLYNRRIAELEAQERLGWRAAAASEPGQVTLTIVDRAGEPLAGLAVKGRVERPATDAETVTLKFVEAEPGRYVAPTGRLVGAWDLKALAVGPSGGKMVAERRLTWP
ncbi:MAG: FixH family protein [Phenylobacterium sp.]|nr:FixH family protein [Phenylobacterium sp.]